MRANPRKLGGLRHARGWAAIAFGPAGLELTTARSEGTGVNVLKQSSASAAPPAGTPDAAPQWQSAAQSLRQQFDPREHRVVTSVSCEDVLCQILRLPATEAAQVEIDDPRGEPRTRRHLATPRLAAQRQRVAQAALGIRFEQLHQPEQFAIAQFLEFLRDAGQFRAGPVEHIVHPRAPGAGMPPRLPMNFSSRHWELARP